MQVKLNKFLASFMAFYVHFQDARRKMEESAYFLLYTIGKPFTIAHGKTRLNQNLAKQFEHGAPPRLILLTGTILKTLVHGVCVEKDVQYQVRKGINTQL